MANKKVDQITIINASQITVSFDDNSSVGLRVGDSVDVSAFIPEVVEDAAPIASETAPVEPTPVDPAPTPEVAPEDAPASTEPAIPTV